MTTAQAKQIEDIIAPALTSLGYEVVRIQISGGKSRATVQIMIDRIDGTTVQIDDCETASRHISALLDVEDPLSIAYVLEVSSPGIDRPLTRKKDFAAWQGFDVRIETAEMVEGRRRFKGTILNHNDNGVTVRVDNQEYQVPFAAIHKAQLILTDALIDEAEKRATPPKNHEIELENEGEL